MIRDAFVTALLTVAWTLLTVGLLVEEQPMVYAAVPSLGGALALHVVGMRKRTSGAEGVLEMERRRKA